MARPQDREAMDGGPGDRLGSAPAFGGHRTGRHELVEG
jgi:hypothetical protein